MQPLTLVLRNSCNVLLVSRPLLQASVLYCDIFLLLKEEA